jgi:hypothetical protein
MKRCRMMLPRRRTLYRSYFTYETADCQAYFTKAFLRFLFFSKELPKLYKDQNGGYRNIVKLLLKAGK